MASSSSDAEQADEPDRRLALHAAGRLSAALDAYVYQSAWRQCPEKLEQFGHERCERFEAVRRGDKHDN